MCNNNCGWGGSNALWILLLLILVCCGVGNTGCCTQNFRRRSCNRSQDTSCGSYNCGQDAPCGSDNCDCNCDSGCSDN